VSLTGLCSLAGCAKQAPSRSWRLAYVEMFGSGESKDDMSAEASAAKDGSDDKGDADDELANDSMSAVFLKDLAFSVLRTALLKSSSSLRIFTNASSTTSVSVSCCISTVRGSRNSGA
jgi:hypothetical protein